MNPQEQNLLDYLKVRLDRQIPYAVIQDELKHLIHSVYQSGMKDAADIVGNEEHAPHDEASLVLLKAQQAILTAANKPL